MSNFSDKIQAYDLPVLERGVRLPEFKIDDELISKYGIADGKSDYDLLNALCEEGLKNRVGLDHERILDYRERMSEELKVFYELGFSSYVLITWDIVRHCKDEGIPTGFARGSAGNSLVLYLIGVTHIDSLKYNLYFERFLNRARAKFKEVEGVRYYDGGLLMDVDLDIGASDRKRLVEWVNTKYHGRIAKLPTLITLTTKTLIKEVCKSYMEMNEDDALEVSDMIPSLYNNPKSLDESYEENEEFRKFSDSNKDTILVAKRIFELYKYYGVHASAWIISHGEIGEMMPLKMTKSNELCSVYPMDDSSEMAIKVDLLGLKCVSLIDSICKKVNVDPYNVPVEDEKVYEWMQRLESPKGLFQIEGDCNLRVARQIKPKTLEHLAAIVALARPGVLQFSGTYAKYLETGEFQSVHPFFDDILKDTAGIPLYQESLLRMANSIGFSLTQSETLRRIIGKKKVDEMPKWERAVREKVKEKGLPSEVGDVLWKIMDDSKNYSFNAGHATGYALMSYVTAYLKYHYPQEFFLSLLELTVNKQDTIGEIQEIENELPNFGIKLLGPDIMKSGINFSTDGADIRFGLAYIKGISSKSFAALQDFKHDYPNKISIFCSAKQSGINIGLLSALIQAGAMDSYIDTSRSRAVLDAQTWSILTDREKLKAIDIAGEFNYDVVKVMQFLKSYKGDNGKPFVKESRIETIRKKYKLYKAIYDKNKENEDLASWWYEKRLLGYSYSQKLFNIVKEFHPDLISIEEAIDQVPKKHVTVCGEITSVKYWNAKQSKLPSFRASIADSTGQIDALLFGDSIESEQEANGNERFQKDGIVVIEGTKTQDGRGIYANRITRKDAQIYMKLKELKQ